MDIHEALSSTRIDWVAFGPRALRTLSLLGFEAGPVPFRARPSPATLVALIESALPDNDLRPLVDLVWFEDSLTEELANQRPNGAEGWLVLHTWLPQFLNGILDATRGHEDDGAADSDWYAAYLSAYVGNPSVLRLDQACSALTRFWRHHFGL